MLDVYGVSGAGYIWHKFMERVLRDRPVRDFPRPPGIQEVRICAETGLPATAACRQQVAEVFAGNGPALAPLAPVAGAPAGLRPAGPAVRRGRETTGGGAARPAPARVPLAPPGAAPGGVLPVTPRPTATPAH